MDEFLKTVRGIHRMLMVLCVSILAFLLTSKPNTHTLESALQDIDHLRAFEVNTRRLQFDWRWEVSAVCLALLISYLISMLHNAAKRMDRRGGSEFPGFRAMLVQLLCFILIAVSSYANLYMVAGGIRNEKNQITLRRGLLLDSSTPVESKDKEGRPVYLTAAQAFYFSAITIATVGYGDIVPVDNLARWLAVGEIATGLLILICVFPITLSRLSAFPELRDTDNAPPNDPSIEYSFTIRGTSAHPRG